MQPARKPVTTLEAASWLLASGLVIAAVRISWRSHLFSTPQGSGALTDLLGCLLSTFSMFSVLAVRGLAAGSVRSEELEDGVSALAAAGWAFALVPPRLENYVAAGSPDDFIFAYVPMSLAVGVLARVVSSLTRRRSPFDFVQRQALLTGLSVAILAAAVAATGGIDSARFVQRAAAAAGLCALVWVALETYRRRFVR